MSPPRQVVYFAHCYGLVNIRRVSETEAKRRFVAIIDAAQRESVVIRRQNRDVAVIMSAQEYAKIRGVYNDEFERFCNRVSARAKARGLTEEILAEILKD